jgi:hypothetical protein
MKTQDKSDLFAFMLQRVAETQKEHLEAEPQAFARWFADLFFMSPRDVFVSDGSKDGKIDMFFKTDNGKTVLFRFFRKKGFFYERRNREWGQRSRELRSVGTKYGINIKLLSQLMASFHWSKARLRPAVAKNVADLFEGEVYEKIRATHPELAFQLFLLNDPLQEIRKKLAGKKVYIRKLKSYATFALFSVVVRALTDVGAKWGSTDLTSQLHGQWEDYYPKHYNNWEKLTKACIDHILAAFEKESRQSSKRDGQELTYANYFKSQGALARMLNSPLGPEVRRLARTALNS